MGEVLYNDGLIAVVDYGDLQGGGVDEHVLKILLEVSPTNIDTRIADLLGVFAVQSSIYIHAADDEWMSAAIAHVDLPSLEALGFDTEGSYLMLREPENVLRRFALSIPDTKEKALRVAEYIQYLCKLYLLSKGDRRHYDLIPDVALDNYAMSFNATLPWAFLRNLDSSRIDTCADFDTALIKPVEESVSFSVPVRIGYANVQRFPNLYVGNHPHKMPDEQLGIKSVAASAMLSSLINYQASIPFKTDSETLELRRSDTDTLAYVLADCIIAGKIIACPWCGRPMLRLRKSSKPFCRGSHQTRYSEKAHAMFDKGATVDEVAAAFPYINRKTIANW